MDKKLKDLLENSFPENIYNPSKPTIRLQEVNYSRGRGSFKVAIKHICCDGEKTKLFEQLWSRWIGRALCFCKYGTFIGYDVDKI